MQLRRVDVFDKQCGVKDSMSAAEAEVGVQFLALQAVSKDVKIHRAIVRVM